MLTSMRIQGFKSWRDTGPIELGRVTAFFGANSSGKTSLLQFLLMMRQTAASTDQTQPLNLGDPTSAVWLGTMQDIVHGRELPGSLTMSLCWRLPSRHEVADPGEPKKALFSGQELAWSGSVIGVPSGPPVPTFTQYVFDGRVFNLSLKDGELSEKYRLHDVQPAYEFHRRPGRPWDLRGPMKCYRFPNQLSLYYENADFLRDFEHAFEELMGRVFYLGPLRAYPRANYPWAGAQPADMGPRGELAVDAMLAAQHRGERISRGRGHKRLRMDEYVAWWLRELGLVESFDLRRVADNSNLYEVWIRQSSVSAEVRLTDVGFGVSQILPVLALCYYVPAQSVILLEQPEIHLHPAVQSGLADVLLDAAKRRNVQIIVESHSEHLLRRLQRRVAEERVSSDDVKLYFCEMKGTESRLTRLRLNLFGAIENWPDGFFGEPFEEVAAIADAALRRQVAEA